MSASARLLRERVDRIGERYRCVGLAMGVVRGGRLESFAGHGVADLDDRRAVTPDTGFRIASITKTVTAVAVLQLWEQGLIELDAPADRYLRALRLVPAAPGHRPASVRDLLTHSAGLGEVAHAGGLLRPDWGESVPEGERLPSLADFYGGAIRLDAEPGSRFIYGNHSPAVLGQLVEDVTGEPLDRVFRERIFEPLGMADSDLLRSAAVKARLATGYHIGRHGAKPVEERDMVTAGAASVYSTPRDMARYAAALLGGGRNGHGSVLRGETVAMMFAPHYQPDPRLPGMGLGFFRADLGGHPVVEHQGVHPGFHSQLALAPEDGVGVIAFTNGAQRPMFWLPGEVAGLLRELVGAPADGVRPGPPPSLEVWHDIRGWYRLAAAPTDIRLRAMLGAGIEVIVRDDGPRLRFLTPIPDLYRGFALHPDDRRDPDVFRVDLGEMGTTRVVFGRRPDGSVAAVHLELMPLSLARQPAASNPRLWVLGTLGLLVAAGAVALLRRAFPGAGGSSA